MSGRWVGDVSVEKVRELAELALAWFPDVQLNSVTMQPPVDLDGNAAPALIIRFISGADGDPESEAIVVIDTTKKITDLSLVAALRHALMQQRNQGW